MKVVAYFFHIVMYIQVKRIIEEIKLVGWDLVQCFGFRLDGGKSESCLQSNVRKLTK